MITTKPETGITTKTPNRTIPFWRTPVTPILASTRSLEA
jgi:hypothetical protein